MEMVTNEIGKFAKKHEERLHHVNVEAIQLLDNSELVRRLKGGKKSFELVFTTTPWLYSPCRTLASFTTIFQSSLLAHVSSSL